MCSTKLRFVCNIVGGQGGFFIFSLNIFTFVVEKKRILFRVLAKPRIKNKNL